MILVAAVGYSLGYADCLQGQEGSVLVYAWPFLVASLVGLVPGYGLGRGA